KPGDPVIVVGIDGKRVNGKLVSLDAASIVIDPGGAKPNKSMNAAVVGRILIRDSLHNGVLIGVGIGAAVGAVGGAYAAATGGGSGGDSAAFAVLSMAALAGIGAAAGGATDAARNRIVFDRSELRLEPESHVEFFMSTLSDFGGRTEGRFTTPPFLMPDPRTGVAAGFGIHLISGFRFEIEIERSIHSAVKD